jgi:acyltransferase
MKDRTVLALKGLAIIGVAYHHISNRRLDPEVLDTVHNIVLLFRWCVLAFFCVSGYLQALSDTKKQRPFLEFTRVKITRLLLPFFALVVFYSCLWQIVQATHIPDLAVKIPTDFVGKLLNALWPVDSQVAEQLYFFPLLFGISMVLIVVQKLLRLPGMWAAAIIAFAAGLVFFPDDFTRFKWGAFVWGIGFYAAGYLLFHYRERKSAIRLTLLAVTITLIAVNGGYGILRCVPLWLLAEGSTIHFDRIPFFTRLGEASGTIYIYHTPFLMQPLVIAATYLPGKIGQFIGINLAVVIAIGLCFLLFENLKDTRAKAILM